MIVNVEGFEYQILNESNGYLLSGDYYIDLVRNKLCQHNGSEMTLWMGLTLKTVVASNNPAIQLPSIKTT